ncbi:hypothetical protein [Curtobacterium sp. MCPF17_052]|uniref:hypothetical protein n=1 Tax=Curtobacterium sp. MCPF17_052 TaxID=2175655 RepID=UPI0024DFC42D|nr:hypothetical protein [Curtobacterium sp. MCPF17_052]WIB12093.1 hypothetical protein DEJ36_15070 [Curtobacterium sp. MCPF17_052]
MYPTGQDPASSPGGEDQRAVERYRYLLRTAPPERIEEVHAEAFATLTPEQRRMVYDEFTRTAPAGEAPRGDDPRSLAQSATRSELRQPGYMERSLGGIGGGGMGGGFGGRQGSGFGSMLGASLLGTVGGYVIGSALMSAFLPDPGSFDGGTDASGADDGGSGGTLVTDPATAVRPTAAGTTTPPGATVVPTSAACPTAGSTRAPATSVVASTSE